METCRFSDFMQSIRPWLNDAYVRKAVLDDQGNCHLFFVDGGERTYQIDNCTRDQLAEIFERMKKDGVAVEKLNPDREYR